MASPPGWAEKLAAKLKANGLQVRLAPHPGDKGKMEKDLAALKGASLLHIWSSAMGVRAMVEGIPVQYHAPHWICGKHVDRVDALKFMAQNQWHYEEISAGEPFARILAGLSTANW